MKCPLVPRGRALAPAWLGCGGHAGPATVASNSPFFGKLAWVQDESQRACVLEKGRQGISNPGVPLAPLTQPCLPSPPLLGPSSLWDKRLSWLQAAPRNSRLQTAVGWFVKLCKSFALCCR